MTEGAGGKPSQAEGEDPDSGVSAPGPDMIPPGKPSQAEGEEGKA